MRTSSRTLIGFGIGIAVLVLVTIILVLTVGKSTSPLLAENIPAGAVQHYLLAIQEKDYAKAYTYLAPQESQSPQNIKEPVLTYNDWLQSAQYSSNSTWKANLGEVDINGETASVTVMIETLRGGGPFGSDMSSHNMTVLLKKAGAGWLIVSPTDLYWLY